MEKHQRLQREFLTFKLRKRQDEQRDKDAYRRLQRGRVPVEPGDWNSNDHVTCDVMNSQQDKLVCLLLAE